MIITTAFTVEGKSVREYLGVVSAAMVMVMPGGNKAVQRGWQAGVDGTTNLLKQQAADLGADAIIAARFEPHGVNICATGTAVKLR